MNSNKAMNAARSLVVDKVLSVADRPDNALRPHEAGSVARAVADELAPVMVNETNNEAWYQSRVIIGNIVALILATMALIGLLRSGVTDVEILGAPVGIILANGFSLYGRVVKGLRPLGT